MDYGRPVALAGALVLLAGCGAAAKTLPARTHSTPIHQAAAPRTDPAWTSLRLPPVPPGPVPGYILIADRNNNRILIVSPGKKVVWSRTGLRGPDDAFFTPGYRSVITNEEFNDTLTEVALRTGEVIWTYGHAQVAGSSAGYLNTPDDAYRLPAGSTTVADIRNCRIVQLTRDRKVKRVLGGSCTHNPPYGFASPNGDTPLPDGGLLVTEIGGWIDRLDRNGHLVWSVRSPVSYPSDAQLLPNGRILVSSFTVPGKIVEMTTTGTVTWSFGDSSGPNFLNKPSLAERWPNGLIAANDDYGEPRDRGRPAHEADRVAVRTHRDRVGSSPGYLSKPDGLDLLPAAVKTRTKATAAPPAAGATSTTGLKISRVGSLPATASRVAAVARPDGRLMVARRTRVGNVFVADSRWPASAA